MFVAVFLRFFICQAESVPYEYEPMGLAEKETKRKEGKHYGII